MRVAILLALSVAAVGMCGAGTPGDWPGWRGLEREGRAAPGNYPIQWSPERNIRWKAPVPGKGHSSPIVVGNRVFLTAASVTGRGEGLKRAAGIAVLTATGLLALLTLVVAVRALWRERAVVKVAALGLCVLLAALAFSTFAAFWQNGQAEMGTERRMELWLLSSVAASLCLALAAYGSRRVRLGVGLASLLFAALVILGRPDPRYFDMATPGRYAGELLLTAALPAALGLTLLGGHAAGLWKSRALLSNGLAIAAACVGAAGFLERNCLLTTKEFARAIVCLDRDTGAVKWTRAGLRGPQPPMSHRNSPATATPLCDSTRVFAWFGSAGAMCTDLDGAVLWANTEVPFDDVHGLGASPILADGLLIIPGTQPDAPYVAALDAATGRRVWTTELRPWPGGEGQARTPAVATVDGRKLLLIWGWDGADKEDFLRALDIRSGQELWRYPVPTYGEQVASVVSDGDTVFLATSRMVRALNLSRLSRAENPAIWAAELKCRGQLVASPVLCNGRLFVASAHRDAHCLDAKSGELLWSQQLNGRGCMASPVAAGGAIYFPDVSGRVTVVAAERAFRSLAENDLGEPIWASPAPMGGRLYVRTTGHLWCIEEKP